MISIKILMTTKFIKAVGKTFGMLLAIWLSHKVKQTDTPKERNEYGILSRIKRKAKRIKRQNI